MHIIYGFLLKWKGGYPFENLLNEDEAIFYKLLEKGFLNFPEQTPEKGFCSKEYWIKSQQEKSPTNASIENNVSTISDKLKSTKKHQTEEERLKIELYNYRFDKFYKEKILILQRSLSYSVETS